jgi:DNA-binding transcriptional LysR family regulator
VPELLAAFMPKHPAVEIFIEPGTSMNLYLKVLDASLDAAIIVEPSFPLPKTLTFRPIRSEPLIVIAPARLGACDDPDRLLADEPLIRYDRQHWGGRLADDYLRMAGIKPQERLELDSLEAIAVLVDRGLGISLVPDWAPPWPAELNLVKIPLKSPAPRRTIGALWSQASLRIAIIRAFLGD